MNEISKDNSYFIKIIANLLEVGIEHHKPNIRRWIVLHNNDQEILKKIALEDPYPDIRAEAVKNITDDEFLGDIARNDSNYYVKSNAIQSITDRKILMILRLTVIPSLQPVVIDRIRDLFY